MRFNWGMGIAVFYASFVAAMVFMVVWSTQNTVHLVQRDYYEDDLNYEAFRQKRQNSNLLKNPVEIKYVIPEKTIRVSFPDELTKVKGTVNLFRPSNHFDDILLPIKLNNQHEMEVPVKGMKRGLWTVKVTWESGGKAYYKEEDISI